MSVVIRSILILAVLVFLPAAAHSGQAKIAAGESHAVLVKPDGTLWGWGANGSGQLGDNGSDRATPTRIGLADNWVSVAAGADYTLALQSDGGLWSWGNSYSGQLGTGIAYQDRPTPQRIGGDAWSTVSAGNDFALAIRADGTLWAWGDNTYGQLGINSYNFTITTPQPVNYGSTMWKAVSAGSIHSLAVRDDGTLWAWGDNTFGQMGTGSSGGGFISPVQIGSEATWIAVSAGNDFSLALKSDGSLWAWGNNADGQLGFPGITASPQRVPATWGLSLKCTAIETSRFGTGGNYSMVIMSDGTRWGWGDNSFGQLGDGSTIRRTTPKKTYQAVQDSLWLGISSGGAFALGIDADGTVWSWGNGGNGQLGNGNNAMSSLPLKFLTIKGWKSVAAGTSHTLGLKADGTLWAWGSNNLGQVGDGTITPTSIPTRLFTEYGPDNDWAWISAGYDSSFAIKSDGTMWAWGNNDKGQLGTCNPGHENTPQLVCVLTSNWVSVATGNGHTIGLKADGTIWTWGSNSQGQLGTPLLVSSSLPQQVGTGQNWVAVAAGDSHSMALRSDGTLWTWGSNSNGQLGYYTAGDQMTPAQLSGYYGQPPWQSIAASANYSAAIQSNGSIWNWGKRLGGNGTSDITSPQQLTYYGQYVSRNSLATGAGHSLFITAGGYLNSWGDNAAGQLGNGNTFASTSPGQVGYYGDTFWTRTAAGGSHSLALRVDGTLWGWGANDSGQLGDGTTVEKHAPQQLPIMLQVTIEGLGSGTVSAFSNPSQYTFNCNGNACTGSYTPDTVVYLNANPTSGSSNAVWSGCDSSSNNQCTVSMADSRKVTVRFNDIQPPYMTSVTSTTPPGSYKAGSTINISLNFNEPVSSVDGLTILFYLDNGVQHSIPVAPFSNSITLNLSYIVQANENVSALSSFSVAGTITDQSDNATYGPSLPYGTGNYWNSFRIDTVAPTFTTSGPSKTITSSGPVTYQLDYFHQGVGNGYSISLSPADINLIRTGSANGSVSVSTDISSPYRRIVTINSITGDGTLAIVVNPGTATDLAGNTAGGTGALTSFIVDNTPPTVDAGGDKLKRSNFLQTGTASDTRGIVAYQWTHVSGPGYIYFDPANDIETYISASTDGSYILRLTVTDSAGNSAFSDMTLTWDTTPPSVSISAPSAPYTRHADVTYTVTYTGASAINLTAASIVLNSSGTATGTVAVSGSGNTTRTVTISNITGDGTLWPTLYPGGTAVDAAGNTTTFAITNAGPFTVDNTPPTVSISAPSASLTRNSDVSYTVTYGAADSINLTPALVTINKTGTASNSSISVSTTSATTRTVTLGGITGDGTLGISIKSGTAGDLAGNTAPSAGPSSTFQVDNTSPAVTITRPLDHSSQTSVYFIDGTASDTGSGISKIEEQITDGTYCFAPNGATMLVTACPGWFTATGTTNWSTPFASAINALLNPNVTYTIRVRATDVAGNVSPDTVSTFTKVTQIFQDPSTLTMDRSSTNIPSGNTMTVSGILSRYCSSGNCNLINLSNRKITISIKKDGAAVGSPMDVFTSDVDGHYVSPNLGPFVQQGTYTIEAKYAGDPDLQSSPTIVKSLQVGKPAGYAIIIEGKLNADPDGIATHTKSARRAYMALRERDFDVANIYWFNQGPALDPANGNAPLPVNDTAPTAANIGKLFNGTTPFSGNQTLASLMTVNPAPIYLIMIDHGSREQFHLGDENITPATINSWLQNLDNAMNDNGRAEKKIIIIGACYSGSFIQPLPGNASISAPGRVIVTSASDGEQSFRGGYDGQDNGVQSGEYFLDEFFASLKRFSSIRNAFSEAAEKTWRYTRKSFEPTNATAPFVGAAQHPLLDDNGDKVGSFLLTDAVGGDGSVSASIYLGASPVVNSVGDPADLSQVASTIYIDAGSSALPSPLWATSGNNPQISSVWVELLRPSKPLSGNGSSIQVTRLTDPGDRHALNAINGHFEYNGFTFAAPNIPGRYEATYYAIDAQTGNPSPSKRTVVYLDYTENDTPVAPTLMEPDAGGLIQNPDPLSPNPWIAPNTKILFRWSPGSDNHAITYKLEVCTNDLFTQNCFVKDEIIETFYLAGKEAGLLNTTPYYWRVWTVDAHGKRTHSPSRTFTTSTENSLPGFIQGFVVNASSGAPIIKAVVTAGGYIAETDTNGAFAIPRNAGIYTVTAAFNGFTSKSSNISVVSGASANLTFSLSPVPVATCGASNSGSFDLAPASNLCNPGTPSPVTGSGPWNWTCTNGGATASCSAAINSYPLTVTYAGNGGSGSVNSDLPGIHCTDNVCPSASYNYGKVVKLTEVPDSQSIFSGWSGNCIIDVGGNCDVTMNGTQNVAVAFNIRPPIWLGGAVYPATLADAFFAAANLVTIKTKATTISVPAGDVTFNENGKSVTLKGGFDAGYAGNGSGYTTIEFTNGKLAVKDGTLKVQQLHVKPKP